MMLELKVEKVYGLNKSDYRYHFDFDTKKINYVFAGNGVGKSSIVKFFKLIDNGKDYEKLFSTDSDEWSFILKDNTQTVCNFSNDNNIESSAIKPYNYFIYDRELRDNLIVVNTDTEEEVMIGENIKQLNEYKKEKIKLVNDTVRDIKRIIPFKKQEFISSSKLIGIVTNDSKLKDEAFKTIIDYSCQNFKIYNIIQLEDLNKVRLELYLRTSELIDKIQDELSEEVFKTIVHNNTYVELIQRYGVYKYEEITKFLDDYNDNFCPICLKSDFDKDYTSKIINDAFAIIINHEVIEDVKDLYNSINNKFESDTELSCLTKKILKSIINKDIEYFNDNYSKCISYYESIVEYYDNYIVHYIINELEDYDKIFSDYSSYCNKIETINSNNEHFLGFSNNTQDDFTKILNKILEINCHYLGIKAYINTTDSASSYYISLKYNELHNDDLQISKLFNEVLSESEKNKIALSFYMAKVIKSTADNKFILVDDPFDSYDNESQYAFTKILSEFLYKKNRFKNSDFGDYIACDAPRIVLTHSKDFVGSCFRIPGTTDEARFQFMTIDNVFSFSESELPIIVNKTQDTFTLIENEIKKGSIITNELFITYCILLRDYVDAIICNLKYVNIYEETQFKDYKESLEKIKGILSEHLVHVNIFDIKGLDDLYGEIKDYDFVKLSPPIFLNLDTSLSLYTDVNDIFDFSPGTILEDFIYKTTTINLVRRKYDYITAYLRLFSKIKAGNSGISRNYENVIRERFNKINTNIQLMNDNEKDIIRRCSTLYHSSILMTNDFAHYHNSFSTPYLLVRTQEIKLENQNVELILTNPTFINIKGHVDSYFNNNSL